MSTDDMDHEFHAKLQAAKGTRWVCTQCGPDVSGEANFYQTERTYVDSDDNELSVENDGMMRCSYCGSVALDRWFQPEEEPARS